MSNLSPALTKASCRWMTSTTDAHGREEASPARRPSWEQQPVLIRTEVSRATEKLALILKFRKPCRKILRSMR